MSEIKRHNAMAKNKKITPWAWIPTLYFAQGLPYVSVMTIAVIMYKRLGLSNTDIALYTSWLYLPWVIKPLWSPFVDLVKTKRVWILVMQGLVAAGFAGVAFSISTHYYLQVSLAFFWLLAFSSATHDVAADGFYMLGLTSGEQSFFVGIRNTFYRFATVFGQGVLVMLAGWLEKESIPLAWSIVFYLLAALFIGFTLYHKFALPRPASDVKQRGIAADKLLKEFFRTFFTFFKKKDLFLMLFFLLTYRLGESQLVKIASPFLLDTSDKGGMGLSTTLVGMIYGTTGVIFLLLGGIIGGLLISRHGLKKWIIPMAIALNATDLFYIYMAATTPVHVWLIAALVALEQLGYGFGFTAYLLYLIYTADGEHKTAHYAIGTGFMALGMMLPGMFAGRIQEMLGYTDFFIWVCICTLPGMIASVMVRNKIDASFGKRKISF